MSRLCIIPARGGSKRIPRKNIRNFLGKPIVAYSIGVALESGLFDEVMVSTEDEEIARVANAFGAGTPFRRSMENADDYASTLDVLEEVLSNYSRVGKDFDEVTCLYATAPFVTKDLLRQASELRAETDADCVFPVLRYGFPVQRSLLLTEGGTIQLREPNHLLTRSQDLEPVYHDTGMFYTFAPQPVRTAGRLWTANSRVIELNEMEAHDIDTPSDWEVAGFKYRLLHER